MVTGSSTQSGWGTAGPGTSFRSAAETQAYNDCYTWWYNTIKGGPGKNWNEAEIITKAMDYAQNECFGSQAKRPGSVSLPGPPNKLKIGDPTGVSHVPAAVRKSLLAQLTPLAPTSLP